MHCPLYLSNNFYNSFIFTIHFQVLFQSFSIIFCSNSTLTLNMIFQSLSNVFVHYNQHSLSSAVCPMHVQLLLQQLANSFPSVFSIAFHYVLQSMPNSFPIAVFQSLSNKFCNTFQTAVQLLVHQLVQ